LLYGAVRTSSRNQTTSKVVVLLLATIFAGGSVLVGWTFYAPAVFIVDDGILVELI
jgi:heme/copper-type cytochrome/quinol oxidase subunit 1